MFKPESWRTLSEVTIAGSSLLDSSADYADLAVNVTIVEDEIVE